MHPWRDALLHLALPRPANGTEVHVPWLVVLPYDTLRPDEAVERPFDQLGFSPRPTPCNPLNTRQPIRERPELHRQAAGVFLHQAARAHERFLYAREQIL